jgi:hypothetical protein
LVFYFSDFGAAYNAALRSLVYVLAPVLSLIFCLLAIKANGYKNPHGRALVFFFAAILCWGIGEFLWSYYDFVLGIDPFPTIADLFYVIAYPFFFLGFIQEFGFRDLKFAKMDKVLLFFTALIFLFAFVGEFYFGVYLAYSGEASLYENIFSIAYGVGDLIIIGTALLLILVVWEFRHGKVFIPWALFFLALVMVLLADIYFSIYEDFYENKIFPYFQIADSLWILSYIFFASAFFSFREIILDVQRDLRRKMRSLS